MQHYSFQKTFFFVSKDGQTNPFRVITLYYVNAAWARVKGFLKFIYKKSRSRPVEGKDKEIFSSGQNRAVGEGGNDLFFESNIHEMALYLHGREDDPEAIEYVNKNLVMKQVPPFPIPQELL